MLCQIHSHNYDLEGERVSTCSLLLVSFMQSEGNFLCYSQTIKFLYSVVRWGLWKAGRIGVGVVGVGG